MNPFKSQIEPNRANKLKKSDQQKVLDALDHHGPMSRRELSLATGIPSPNLSSPLKRLIKWELVVVIGSCSPAGRRANRYALNNRYVSVPYDFLSRLAKATRYKSSREQFIEASFSGEAEQLLKEMQGTWAIRPKTIRCLSPRTIHWYINGLKNRGSHFPSVTEQPYPGSSSQMNSTWANRPWEIEFPKWNAKEHPSPLSNIYYGLQVGGRRPTHSQVVIWGVGSSHRKQPLPKKQG